MIELLHKIRREVGVSLFRLPAALASVAWETRLRPKAKVDPDRLQRGIPSFPRVGSHSPTIDPESDWPQVASRLAKLSVSRDIEIPDLTFLAERGDDYYRGDYDAWEYHLIPWLRAYADFAVAYMDPRLQDELAPVWSYYDALFRNERPWMTRLATGSNVSGVLGGYALHALLGALQAPQSNERTYYRRQYEDLSSRFRRALRLGFDGGVPMEGTLYGCFMMHSGWLLGLIEDELGLPSCLSLVEAFPAYVLAATTPKGDFVPLGDCHPESHLYTRELFTTLARRGNGAAQAVEERFGRSTLAADLMGLP